MEGLNGNGTAAANNDAVLGKQLDMAILADGDQVVKARRDRNQLRRLRRARRPHGVLYFSHVEHGARSYFRVHLSNQVDIDEEARHYGVDDQNEYLARHCRELLLREMEQGDETLAINALISFRLLSQNGNGNGGVR
jgi:hypothetical protein